MNIMDDGYSRRDTRPWDARSQDARQWVLPPAVQPPHRRPWRSVGTACLVYPSPCTDACMQDISQSSLDTRVTRAGQPPLARCRTAPLGELAGGTASTPVRQCSGSPQPTARDRGVESLFEHLHEKISATRHKLVHNTGKGSVREGKQAGSDC